MKHISRQTIARTYIEDGPYKAMMLVYFAFTYTGGEAGWQMTFHQFMHRNFKYLNDVWN